MSDIQIVLAAVVIGFRTTSGALTAPHHLATLVARQMQQRECRREPVSASDRRGELNISFRKGLDHSHTAAAYYKLAFSTTTSSSSSINSQLHLATVPGVIAS